MKNRNTDAECIAHRRQKMNPFPNPKINLDRNPKIWHLSYGVSKLELQEMRDRLIQIFNGSHDITTASYKTISPILISLNTFLTILKIGTKRKNKTNRDSPQLAELIKSLDFKIWQRNYHDHIIRNHFAYFNIATYIDNNPKKWEENKKTK